ncbi:MAG TPA: alpha/beta hydrolase-fold protein [Verrucomicrobiae bacterium]|nr:alpha/beta hydrolase-fold protein [Verrucomicrobiae bacterium]
MHDYQSKALGQRRQLLVYTPSGYNANLAQRYPLLVLQHGFGGSRSSWVAHGRANLILDNLIAAGEAKPMVVMMIDGHSSGTYQGREIKGVESFSLELLEDALPLVERDYRLAELPENRAIVGLSMGAKQSTTVGLGNLDRFAWVGGFSAISYPDPDTLKILLASPEETNRKLKLLWLAWGSGDARAVKAGEPFVDQLEKAGIKLQWKVTEGGHEWPVWQRCLVDILPLLFQK